MSTIKAVAERAGVSTATVSRALSNPEVVQPETRARVQQAIEALNYAPNHAAKSLRMLRTSKIMVMVPDVANPFFSEVLRGAEDAAQLAGYSVLLGDTRDDPEREAQYAAMLQRKEADGLIFLGHRVPPALARIVRSQAGRAPVVNACDYSPDQGVSSAHIDNAKAAAEAVALLYSMGHRRVALIAGPLESHLTRERLRGAREAARAAGLEAGMMVAHADYTIESGLLETGRLLERPEPPTAVFCFSDEIAVGALSACRTRGLDCPADLSIIGFDDVRYARFLDPPLTTVRQPMSRIGETAVKLLLSILDGKATGLERVALPHELVVRASTGPAPTR
jgi:LacI family repressor for deo operon, udp, cdd, tsx, nupC, and nupG